jgi:hypothetical protein
VAVGPPVEPALGVGALDLDAVLGDGGGLLLEGVRAGELLVVVAAPEIVGVDVAVVHEVAGCRDLRWGRGLLREEAEQARRGRVGARVRGLVAGERRRRPLVAAGEVDRLLLLFVAAQAAQGRRKRQLGLPERLHLFRVAAGGVGVVVRVALVVEPHLGHGRRVQQRRPGRLAALGHWPMELPTVGVGVVDAKNRVRIHGIGRGGRGRHG